MNTSYSTPSPSRSLGPWLLAVVVFLGSFVLFTRHNDFPYSYHPDESGKCGQVIKGIRNYHHPLLLLSLTDVASRAGFVARTPQAIVETGRGVAAALAAGAAAALALLAWRCAGLPAGWCAGAAVALQADLFETAHYLKEDPALVFGLALSLLAAHLWWRAPGRKTLRFLGIACGLAAVGKYVGIIVLIFAVPLVVWHRASDAALTRSVRLRLFAFAFAFTFLAGNLPLFATKLTSPFRSVSNEMKGVAGGHRGITREVPHREYLDMLRKDLPPAVGLLAGAYVLALLGTARRRTPPEWVTVLLPLGYLAMISCSPKIASRYLLPVSTLLPLLATLGAAEIAGVVCAADSRWRRAAGAAVLAGLAGWIVWTELPPLRTALAGFTRDDPAEVAAWITANLPPDSVIAEDHRVNLSPDKADGVAKFARVPQKVLDANFAPDLGSVDELLAKGVTHVAVCRASYSRYFNDETGAQGSGKTGYDKRRDFYQRVFRDGELLREWPRGTITYLQPGIRLYRIAPAKAPAPAP